MTAVVIAGLLAEALDARHLCSECRSSVGFALTSARANQYRWLASFVKHATATDDEVTGQCAYERVLNVLSVDEHDVSA